MNEEELIHALEFLRNTMIAVATGGPRIINAYHGNHSQPDGLPRG